MSIQYLLSKICFDKAENEPLKVRRWVNSFFQLTPHEDHEEVEDVEGARRQRLRDDVQPRLAREYLEEARREHEGVDHEPAVEVVQQKGTWAQYEESRS